MRARSFSSFPRDAVPTYFLQSRRDPRFPDFFLLLSSSASYLSFSFRCPLHFFQSSYSFFFFSSLFLQSWALKLGFSVILYFFHLLLWIKLNLRSKQTDIVYIAWCITFYSKYCINNKEEKLHKWFWCIIFFSPTFNAKLAVVIDYVLFHKEDWLL